MDRTTPGPYSGGSSFEDQALAPRRIQAFIQEPARNGNILVTLPDQTGGVTANCQDKKTRMKAHIDNFEQEFNQ